jgi:hypothetical protein
MRNSVMVPVNCDISVFLLATDQSQCNENNKTEEKK